MKDRVPYAERPEVIERHCFCDYVWSLGPDGEPIRHERYRVRHDCPLHGGHAKGAPF